MAEFILPTAIDQFIDSDRRSIDRHFIDRTIRDRSEAIDGDKEDMAWVTEITEISTAAEDSNINSIRSAQHSNRRLKRIFDFSLI